MWKDRESDINRKVTNSAPVKDTDLRRATDAVATLPATRLPPSTFLQALGTPEISNVPPQTASLALRASEDWERSICENRAFAILRQLQTGRSIKMEGCEMLVYMVLDRPLAEAQSLVRNPGEFVEEILQMIKDKKSHPVTGDSTNASSWRARRPTLSEFDPTAPARSSALDARFANVGVPRLACLSQNSSDSSLSRLCPTHKSVSSALINKGNWWLVPCPPSLPINRPLHFGIWEGLPT